MNIYRPDIGAMGQALGEAYAASPRGEQVTALHLFGILHADEMSDLNMTALEEIVAVAGLAPTFATELRKMIKLSRYVIARPSDHAVKGVPTVFERLARPLPMGYTFDRAEANAR